MKKLNIAYCSCLAVAAAVLGTASLTLKDSALAWSIWINALLILILINSFHGVYVREILLSPGFKARYESTMQENLDLWDENTRLTAELDWIKSAPEPQKIVAIPRQDSDGKFIAQDGVSTREKRVRAYLMGESGQTDNDIAAAMGIKVSSVPVYRSQGRKIVQPYKDLVAGMSLDRAVSFFCSENAAAVDK